MNIAYGRCKRVEQMKMEEILDSQLRSWRPMVTLGITLQINMDRILSAISE